MSDVKITRKGFKCLRCGYEWIPRKEGQKPQLCPKCRSAYWNKPRVRHRNPMKLAERVLKEYDEFNKDVKKISKIAKKDSVKRSAEVGRRKK